MTISQAAPANPWREAVLDRLAVLCMDAPQDEPPASILRRIIAAEVEIALDPSVSDVVPAAAPEPEPVAEVFDTFGNSQDPNKAVGHVRLKAHYFPPKGTKLYAAPPAAPAPAAPVPDGWVMVPREPTEDMIQAAAGAWGESEGGLHNAFAAALRGGITASPAAPAQPVVPLTEGRITAIANELAFGGGHCNVYELARAIEKAHGIGGGNG